MGKRLLYNVPSPHQSVFHPKKFAASPSFFVYISLFFFASSRWFRAVSLSFSKKNSLLSHLSKCSSQRVFLQRFSLRVSFSLWFRPMSKCRVPFLFVQSFFFPMDRIPISR